MSPNQPSKPSLKHQRTAFRGGLGVFTSVNSSEALRTKSTPPTASAVGDTSPPNGIRAVNRLFGSLAECQRTLNQQFANLGVPRGRSRVYVSKRVQKATPAARKHAESKGFQQSRGLVSESQHCRLIFEAGSQSAFFGGNQG